MASVGSRRESRVAQARELCCPRLGSRGHLSKVQICTLVLVLFFSFTGTSLASNSGYIVVDTAHTSPNTSTVTYDLTGTAFGITWSSVRSFTVLLRCTSGNCAAGSGLPIQPAISCGTGCPSADLDIVAANTRASGSYSFARFDAYGVTGWKLYITNSTGSSVTYNLGIFVEYEPLQSTDLPLGVSDSATHTALSGTLGTSDAATHTALAGTLTTSCSGCTGGTTSDVTATLSGQDAQRLDLIWWGIWIMFGLTCGTYVFSRAWKSYKAWS
jgi:hypothetical protein